MRHVNHKWSGISILADVHPTEPFDRPDPEIQPIQQIKCQAGSDLGTYCRPIFRHGLDVHKITTKNGIWSIIEKFWQFWYRWQLK